MRDVVVAVLLIVGVALQVFAVLGAVVMRDAYDRVHYPSLASFGALLIGIAILVRESFSLIGDKALLIGVLLAASSPLIGHVTARSFRAREHGEWDEGIERHREDGPQ